MLWRTVGIPESFCTTETVGDRAITYGGDIRIGDLRATGQADFLVYRCAGNLQDQGGMKPCFLGAFSTDGLPLWSDGSGGTQPARPGPVAIHDLDGDGRAEVICFFELRKVSPDVVGAGKLGHVAIHGVRVPQGVTRLFDESLEHHGVCVGRE